VALAACDAGSPPRPHHAPLAASGRRHTGHRSCFTLARDGHEVHEPYGPLVDARPVVPPPDCKELVTTVHAPYPPGEKRVNAEEKGFAEYASAAAFEKRYQCARPDSVDFTRDRVVVLPFDGYLSIAWELDSAVRTDTGITAITAMTMACRTNAPDTDAKRVLLFTVPQSDEPLEVVMCINPMPDC
jgi:hypothetical protein